jgi:cytochrome c556
MVRKYGKILAGIVAVVICTTAGLTSVFAADKAEKISIHEIMEKVPGKKGLAYKTNAAAKAEKWDDAAKMAKDLKKYGDALPLTKPAKGSKESWDKLAKEFAVQMNQMATGVEKKDAKMVEAGFTAFGKSCKACHDAHQE